MKALRIKASKPFAWLGRKLREPKWRHGRWNTFALLLFIAACVLLNFGVATLEKNLGWRKDYSFNAYATTGEETRAVLERLEKDVDIYLLYRSGEMDGQLMELLNRYDTLSARIRVHPTDIAKNPGIFNRFQGEMDRALEAGAVVVHCQDTGWYRVLTDDDFVTKGYNVEASAFEIAGLAYEKRLTEALVYVSEEHIPVVGVLQGHGELTMEELQTLTDFWASNRYESRPVSLFGGEGLEGIDLLFIGSPQKDFSRAEIDAIDAFAKQGGSLWVTRDYTDALLLPNYFSLLNNYGVQPLPGVVIAGIEDEGSYYGERMYLMPYMKEMDMTLPLIAGKLDILLLAGAAAFETPREPDESLTVGSVLVSGPNAYLRDPSDGYTGLDRQPQDRKGEMSLALYAHRMHSTGNVSRLFAIGNSAVLTADYMYQSTYNGEFIMQILGELLPQKTVSLDIVASAAFRPGLKAGSQTLGVGLIVALPLCVLAAALLILLPRRNR